MNCPNCKNEMILTQATYPGEQYHYCRTCKKELAEMTAIPKLNKETIGIDYDKFHNEVISRRYEVSANKIYVKPGDTYKIVKFDGTEKTGIIKHFTGYKPVSASTAKVYINDKLEYDATHLLKKLEPGERIVPLPSKQSFAELIKTPIFEWPKSTTKQFADDAELTTQEDKQAYLFERGWVVHHGKYAPLYQGENGVKENKITMYHMRFADDAIKMQRHRNKGLDNYSAFMAGKPYSWESTIVKASNLIKQEQSSREVFNCRCTINPIHSGLNNGSSQNKPKTLLGLTIDQHRQLMDFYRIQTGKDPKDL